MRKGNEHNHTGSGRAKINRLRLPQDVNVGARPHNACGRWEQTYTCTKFLKHKKELYMEKLNNVEQAVLDLCKKNADYYGED